MEQGSTFLNTPAIPRILWSSGFVTYLLTYLLTPWSGVLLEKLTGSQLLKKFPAVYGSLLTYSMEHSPSWEGNRFSASQEFPRILWNPEVHYSFGKKTSLLHLCGTRPIQSTASLIFKTYFNIIIPFMPGSSKCTVSTIFPNENPVRASGLSRTYHITLFYLVNRILFGDLYKT